MAQSHGKGVIIHPGKLTSQPSPSHNVFSRGKLRARAEARRRCFRTEERRSLPRVEGRAPVLGLRSEGARNERTSDEGEDGGPERPEASGEAQHERLSDEGENTGLRARGGERGKLACAVTWARSGLTGQQPHWSGCRSLRPGQGRPQSASAAAADVSITRGCSGWSRSKW